jgi:hypothetical protein
MPSNDYWIGVVRRWLRSGGYQKVETSGGYPNSTRYFITREGLLLRETTELIDPETFAREHIPSADVVSLRPSDDGKPLLPS